MRVPLAILRVAGRVTATLAATYLAVTIGSAVVLGVSFGVGTALQSGGVASVVLASVVALVLGGSSVPGAAYVVWVIWRDPLRSLVEAATRHRGSRGGAGREEDR